MNTFNYRHATENDIPFLVETIIEAEKSGTEILSYAEIFGISEQDVKKYVSKMLFEEIDDCELSVSSFFVAEINGTVVAALSSWIEAREGIPSSRLKGNLLSHVLPRESIQHASEVSEIVRKIHIDYKPGTIQKGAGYVLKEFRNLNLFGNLTGKLIEFLQTKDPKINEVYTQVFGCNVAAIKANEKIGFKIVHTAESDDDRLSLYLPSNKKHLMKKEL